MATIRKPGKPTPKTAGAVGDIYVDLDTRMAYKCTFSYSDSNSSKTYNWKHVGMEDLPREKEKPVVDIPSVSVIEEYTVSEPAGEALKPKHTNYNKQYKKK